MIYALRGLSNNCGPNQLHVKVDYRFGKEELYRRLAVAILTSECSLDILGACQFSPGKYTDMAQPPALPSWVPDWSTPQKRPPLILQGTRQERYMHFAASKNLVRYSPEFPVEESQLLLNGFIVDEISELASHFNVDLWRRMTPLS